MNYTLLNEQEATRVRERFEETFIETPQEYELSAAKWREEQFAENPNAQIYPIPNYNEVIYWSKIKCYKEIDFAEAISFLSSISNPVYFMSDVELEGYVGMHLLNDPRASIGFVAVHDEDVQSLPCKDRGSARDSLFVLIVRNTNSCHSVLLLFL